MSKVLQPRQYTDPKGRIAEGFDGNIIVAEGAAVPADATPGYAPGCLFFKRAGTAGAQVYVNEGTADSSAFKAEQSATLRIARGQATTVTASDTVVTGLASVASVVACLDDAPVIGCDRAQASIGDQAGTPAAGSVLIKTYKPTASGDATPVAATTFGKKVNWIAVGL